MRVVHYVNQFFAGVGGEDSAGMGPEMRDGAVGPGRRLAALLGDEHEIVATVVCGDDYAAARSEFAALLVEQARAHRTELLIAGPAFTSGRYGLACARIASAAAEAGMSAVAAMHPDNPGLAEAAGTPVVESGATAREMGLSLERLAAAARKLATGEELTAEDGRIGPVARINRLAGRTAAERAVALVLARLAGEDEATEIPLPAFDQVTPAAPVSDPGGALIVLLTEGGSCPPVTPTGSSRRGRRSGSAIRSTAANRPKPGRSSPCMEVSRRNGPTPSPTASSPSTPRASSSARGRSAVSTPSTSPRPGTAPPWPTRDASGVEWAAELRQAGIQAAILTAT